MDKVQEDSLTERQQYWLNHIRACEASGKSIADYAVDHAINVKTMYAGKKMLVKKGILARTHSNRFQRAQLTHMAVSHDWQIQLPNGAIGLWVSTTTLTHGAYSRTYVQETTSGSTTYQYQRYPFPLPHICSAPACWV